MRRALFVTVALAVLPGCLDRAGVEATLGPAPDGEAYLALLPTDEILSIETETDAEDLAALEALEARADGAARGASPGGGPSDAELRARAAALRARAAELSP